MGMRTTFFRVVGLVSGLVLLAAPFAAPAAHADGSYRDGRDKGPLDIRSVKLEKVDDWYLAAEVTFGSPIHLKDFRGQNFLVLDIDRTGDGKSDHLLYVAPYSNRFGIYSYNVRDRQTYCCDRGVRKIGSSTLRIRFPQFNNYVHAHGGQLFRVGSYYEGASCPEGCFDVAPNRGWVINDFTPPSIKRFDLPIGAYTGGQPQAPLNYRIADKGLSGIGRHRILVRTSDSDEWQSVATRTGEGSMSYLVNFQPGQTASVKMVVADRAGNVSRSVVRNTTAPIDDATPEVVTFTGLWESRATDHSYLGTEHVSRSPLDEVQYTASATHYCFLYSVGPDYGKALFDVNGVSFEVQMNADVSASLKRMCVNFSKLKERTLTVSELQGEINVDGFWADEIYEQGPSYTDSRASARPFVDFRDRRGGSHPGRWLDLRRRYVRLSSY